MPCMSDPGEDAVRVALDAFPSLQLGGHGRDLGPQVRHGHHRRRRLRPVGDERHAGAVRRPRLARRPAGLPRRQPGPAQRVDAVVPLLLPVEVGPRELQRWRGGTPRGARRPAARRGGGIWLRRRLQEEHPLPVVPRRDAPRHRKVRIRSRLGLGQEGMGAAHHHHQRRRPRPLEVFVHREAQLLHRAIGGRDAGRAGHRLDCRRGRLQRGPHDHRRGEDLLLQRRRDLPGDVRIVLHDRGRRRPQERRRGRGHCRRGVGCRHICGRGGRGSARRSAGGGQGEQQPQRQRQKPPGAPSEHAW